MFYHIATGANNNDVVEIFGWSLLPFITMQTTHSCYMQSWDFSLKSNSPKIILYKQWWSCWNICTMTTTPPSPPLTKSLFFRATTCFMRSTTTLAWLRYRLLQSVKTDFIFVCYNMLQVISFFCPNVCEVHTVIISNKWFHFSASRFKIKSTWPSSWSIFTRSSTSQGWVAIFQESILVTFWPTTCLYFAIFPVFPTSIRPGDHLCVVTIFTIFLLFISFRWLIGELRILHV